MALSLEKRLNGVLEVFASCRLDALPVSAAAIRDVWDYIEGRRALDEIIEDRVRRHTHPEGEFRG